MTVTFQKVREEQHVVAMTIIGDTTDIGATASKAISPGYRYRYSTPIRYTLADGTEFESMIRGLTRPKLLKRINDTFRQIDDRCIFAEQWQDGDQPAYWSTSLRMTLSLR